VEKGPQLLSAAWRNMRERIPLRVVGDGPLLESLSREIKDSSLFQIELAGLLAPEEVRSLMLGARFLISPSICYENFPIAIAEAFACGLPVIAGRLGAMAEIVADGKTGLHFTPGDANDLAEKVEWAWTHPEEMAEMGRAARRESEEKYTGAANYKRLMEIYEMAMAKPVAETAELMAAR
jgi:glycosyltransferase involved in cell wall biosynthesis